jgi:hypothetical protein
MSTPGERFTVVVEALPSDVPAIIRLRRWLKLGLRSLGLKNLSVTEQTAGPQSLPGTPEPPTTTEVRP